MAPLLPQLQIHGIFQYAPLPPNTPIKLLSIPDCACEPSYLRIRRISSDFSGRIHLRWGKESNPSGTGIIQVDTQNRDHSLYYDVYDIGNPAPTVQQQMNDGTDYVLSIVPRGVSLWFSQDSPGTSQNCKLEIFLLHN